MDNFQKIKFLKRSCEKIILTTWLLFCLLNFVPWNPIRDIPQTLGAIRVDKSFLLALIEIYKQRLQFGPEIIWTYGPLGFLHTETIDHHLLGLLFISRTILSLVFSISCWVILKYSKSHLAYKFILSIVLILICLIMADARHQIFWFSFCIFTNVFYFKSAFYFPKLKLYNFLLFVLVICSAFVGLIKFSYTIYAIVQFSIIGFDEIILKRKKPIISSIFLTSLLLFWMFAYQNLINLPIWLLKGWDLAQGYSDAMAKGFIIPYTEVDIVLIYFLACIPFTIYTFAEKGISALPSKLAYFLSFILITYIHLKHCWGGNQIENATNGLLFLSVVYATLIDYEHLKKKSKLLFSSFVTILISGLSLLYHYDLSTRNIFSNSINTVPSYLIDKSQNMTRIIKGEWSEHINSLENEYKQIRDLARLPESISGTTDIYPDYAGIVVAHPNLTYRPRPMFLSLNAHTEEIANINAKFLRSEKAPDNILFEIFVFPALPHDRYPSLADGPSWLEILSRYEVGNVTKDFIVLNRKLNPINYQLEPIEEINANFGQEIAVPQNESELIWAEVDIQRSFIGKIIHFLYKTPPIMMTIKTTQGLEAQYRIVPAMAKAGFLLSPLVSSNGDFFLLASSDTGTNLLKQTNQIKTLRLEPVPNLKSLFSDRVKIKLHKVLFGSDRSNLMSSESKRIYHLQKLRLGVTNSILPIEFRQDKKTVLFAHAPSTLKFSKPKYAKEARVGFGLMDSAFENGNLKTDGAEFRVSAMLPNSQTKILWQKYVDPVSDLKKQVELEATINIEDESITELIFETLPGDKNNTSQDYTYWSKIDFN